MKIAIVGGGITGCVTALAMVKEGHQVSIFEASQTLGGILRDIVTEQGTFLQNCQYLNCAAASFSLLQDIAGLELQVFRHRYGSVNDLFGEAVVHHDFAQVVVPGPMRSFQPGSDSPTTALDRLTCYEPDVATALTVWAGKFGDLSILDAGNCGQMQVGRVFYPDAVEMLRKSKQDSALAEQLFGLPRSEFHPPTPFQDAALPARGFDHFFSTLHGHLEALGVRVHVGCPVKPTRTDGRMLFKARQDDVAADVVVWCANPTPLIRNLTGERIDAPVSRFFNLVATIDGSIPREPIYYQLFGRGHPFTRLFSYTLDGPKVTIEGFDEGIPIDRLISHANDTFAQLGWNARIKDACLVPQRRYMLLTLADRDRFKAFARVAAEHGIVPGGWQHFGRDNRLDEIMGTLRALPAS